MNPEITLKVEAMINEYVAKEITGEELAMSIRINLAELDGGDKKLRRTIDYYDNFFLMEGSNLYVANRYIDEEISELREFLQKL